MNVLPRFLLDANCWMEIVRSRPLEQDVRSLLAAVPASDIFLTDFALHSIGLAMRRHKMLDSFPTFISRTGIGASIGVVPIAPSDLFRAVDVCKSHGIDFEDAYQYVAAELNGLSLVSLDADFDRTPRGRLTPAAALQRFTDEQQQ